MIEATGHTSFEQAFDSRKGKGVYKMSVDLKESKQTDKREELADKIAMLTDTVNLHTESTVTLETIVEKLVYADVDIELFIQSLYVRYIEA